MQRAGGDATSLCQAHQGEHEIQAKSDEKVGFFAQLSVDNRSNIFFSV